MENKVLETKRALLYAPFDDEDLKSKEIPEKYKSNVEFKIARCERRRELGLDKNDDNLKVTSFIELGKHFGILK